MENTTPPPTSTPIAPFLQQVLSTFQDPLYNPETDNYKPMSSILWNLDIFRRNFQNLTDLTDFIELAKTHFTYEVHPYGSVLMKEHEFADKFCLVLQGNLQKLQQRPYQEVEHDIRNSPRRRTYNVQGSQEAFVNGDSFTQSSLFFPRANILMRKPNNSVLNTTNHRLSIDYSQAADSPKIRFKREDSKASLKNESPFKFFNYQESPLAPGESSPKSPRKISVRMSPFSNLPEALESPKEIPKLGGLFGRQKSKTVLKPGKLTLNFAQRTTTGTSWTTDPKQGSPSPRAGARGNGRNSSVGKNESPNDSKSWIRDEDEKSQVSHSQAPENSENIEFIKQIVRKSPEIKQRCFMMEAVRVRCTRTYQPGDYFGENFFKQHQFKENYIIAVASEEVHLAVMSREDYKSIINELAGRPNNKLQFFKKVFPSFEEDCVNRFSQYFYKKRFEKGETIYTQGEPAKDVFLLQDGDVRLFKETQLPAKKGLESSSSTSQQPQTIELPIASITKGQFFGEEILLNEPERLFTATSTVSNTIVYYLDPRAYKKLRGKYEDFLEVLRDQAKNRFLWRKNRVAELASQYKMNSDRPRKSTSMDEQLPTIATTLQKTSTAGLEKLTKRISRRTSTGLSLSLTQYLGENTVWSTIASKSTASNRGAKTSVRDQVENPEAEIAKSSGLYKSRFSRKTLSIKDLEEDEPIVMKRKGEENTIGKLSDSLKKSLVDLRSQKLSILQAASPQNVMKIQLDKKNDAINKGGSSPKNNNKSPSPSPKNGSPTNSPRLRKIMSTSIDGNHALMKGFPKVVVKKGQHEENLKSQQALRKTGKNFTFTSAAFFGGIIKGSTSPKTPKAMKASLEMAYPEASMYELKLHGGHHTRSTGSLTNYMDDSPMHKEEGIKENWENKKLKRMLHMVSYHTGGQASRESARKEDGEKSFVNMHMQAMKKKAYNLIRAND